MLAQSANSKYFGEVTISGSLDQTSSLDLLILKCCVCSNQN